MSIELLKQRYANAVNLARNIISKSGFDTILDTDEKPCYEVRMSFLQNTTTSQQLAIKYNENDRSKHPELIKQMEDMRSI